MELLIFVMVLIVVGIAAGRWGFDSRDSFRSPEWERRRSWRLK